ncbi:unnamed protein product [Caenorhabditis nigoni]
MAGTSCGGIMASSMSVGKLVVTTAKVTLAPPQLILFRSYAPRIDPKEFEQLGYFNPNKILLWKAIRCTSLKIRKKYSSRGFKNLGTMNSLTKDPNADAFLVDTSLMDPTG